MSHDELLDWIARGCLVFIISVTSWLLYLLCLVRC